MEMEQQEKRMSTLSDKAIKQEVPVSKKDHSFKEKINHDGNFKVARMTFSGNQNRNSIDSLGRKT